MINLAFAKRERHGERCQICKENDIDQQTSVIGYRLPVWEPALKKLGKDADSHYLNWEVCCSYECSQRLSKSWQGDKRLKNREELVAKIKSSMEEFSQGFK